MATRARIDLEVLVYGIVRYNTCERKTGDIYRKRGKINRALCLTVASRVGDHPVSEVADFTPVSGAVFRASIIAPRYNTGRLKEWGPKRH